MCEVNHRERGGEGSVQQKQCRGEQPEDAHREGVNTMRGASNRGKKEKGRRRHLKPRKNNRSQLQPPKLRLT